MDTVQCAVAMPMRCPGRFVRRGVSAGCVEASASAMTLCLVAGWEGCSANTLTVSTGGLSMRLSLPSGSGQGRLQTRRHVNEHRLHPLPT